MPRALFAILVPFLFLNRLVRRLFRVSPPRFGRYPFRRRRWWRLPF